MVKYTNESMEILGDLQEEILKIYGKYNLDKSLLWMTEELGELIQAIRKQKMKQEIMGEIGDLFVWIFCIGNILDINLADALLASIDKEVNRQIVMYNKLKYLEEGKRLTGLIKTYVQKR